MIFALLAAAEPDLTRSFTDWLLDQTGMVILLIAVIFAIIKGWLVPGWMYRQVVEAGEKLASANEINARANEKNAASSELSIQMMREIANAISRQGRP